MTKEQKKEFELITNQLIEWVAKNTTPHAVVIVENNRATLYDGAISNFNDKFTLD